MPSSKIGTVTLTNETVTLVETNGIRKIAMKLVSGTVTYLGTLPFGTVGSSPITLADSDPVTVVSDYAMDGFTINASAGSVLLIYTN